LKRKEINEYGFDNHFNMLSKDGNINNGTLIKGLKIDWIAHHKYISNTPYGALIIEQFFFDWKKYYISSSWVKKVKETTVDYLSTGTITNTTTLEYDNLYEHTFVSAAKSLNSTLGTNETKYFYPQDSEMSSKPLMNDLKAINKIDTPIVTQTFKNTQKLSEQEMVFAKDATTANLPFLKTVLVSKGIQNMETVLTYNSYDTKGNVTQYTQENGVPVSIVWGYNNTIVVAKVEGVAYSSIQLSLITAIQTATDSATATEAQVITALNALRSSLPNAMVTTYTHKPLIGVSTVTDPKGNTQTYHYDGFNRLQFVKDHQGNILTENKYNYRPQ
jgi:YD repeat-containing protein